MQQKEEKQEQKQEEQQQQHLFQSQHIMQSYYSNNITTDHIQQYLDENKALILKIVESQNMGKLGECAENQARLQRNLMYLAAIADSQPQPPNMHSQFSPSGTMQAAGSGHYMQQQQQQLNPNMMTPQALMAARSSMVYSQQPYSSLQQHQQQQALHNQLAVNPGGVGVSSGLHQMMQSDQTTSGSLGAFPDFFRGMGSGSKQDHIGGSDGRGGSSSGGDGNDAFYLKSAEDGIN